MNRTEAKKDQFKDREEILSAVNLGANVCNSLKQIYFPDQPWQACYRDVAQKFTCLKQIMRKFYSDKSEIDMLKELQRYSPEDLRSAIES
jgi:predicted nuclease of restriction endonuclease-like RecB superfamily